MTQLIKIKAQDGYDIHGFEWRLPSNQLAPQSKSRAVVIITRLLLFVAGIISGLPNTYLIKVLMSSPTIIEV